MRLRYGHELVNIYTTRSGRLVMHLKRAMPLIETGHRFPGGTTPCKRYWQEQCYSPFHLADRL